jgi:hypothetical protein
MACVREPQFIRKVHEMIFHVFVQPGDELEPRFKEALRQGSKNGAVIPEHLAAQSFDQYWNRSAIIDIAWRQTTGEQGNCLPAARWSL